MGINIVPQATGRIGDLALSVNGNTVTYQPADRFWALQGIEAGIFVALTAAALGATIWLLHRRAAWTALARGRASVASHVLQLPVQILRLTRTYCLDSGYLLWRGALPAEGLP